MTIDPQTVSSIADYRPRRENPGVGDLFVLCVETSRFDTLVKRTVTGTSYVVSAFRR